MGAVIRTCLTLALLAGCWPADLPAQPPAATRPSVEVIEQYWPNGRLRERREVLRQPDGRLVDHGRFTRWYPTGVKEYEATYRHGRLSGLEVAWHPNGRLRSCQSFYKGLRNGLRLDFDDHGRLRQRRAFLAGQPHGTWSLFDTRGRLKWQARFDHGRPLPPATRPADKPAP